MMVSILEATLSKSKLVESWLSNEINQYKHSKYRTLLARILIINCTKVKKYRVPGKVSPDVQKVLQCNELFCNKGGSNSTVGGVLEILSDTAEKQLRLELERQIQKLQYGGN